MQTEKHDHGACLLDFVMWVACITDMHDNIWWRY
nr:MAG TPA: hypothetical protein [Caudoviricetes sp.]